MMRDCFRERWIIGAIAVTVVLSGHIAFAEDPQPDQATVRRHAEESLQRLEHQAQKAGDHALSPLHKSRATPSSDGTTQSAKLPSGEELLTGHGQGDLQKGRLVCQRVSELAARTDLAKQIRVLVKEHATDRIRERTGREPEQDIEVIREEIVQEYLQGVKIVDRRVDEEQKTCTATAVMSKHQILPDAIPDSPQPTSAVTR
ncbi:MAG: LPP20 family lipoprotein [Nitrospiraceae bacterium]